MSFDWSLSVLSVGLGDSGAYFCLLSLPAVHPCLGLARSPWPVLAGCGSSDSCFQGLPAVISVCLVRCHEGSRWSSLVLLEGAEDVFLGLSRWLLAGREGVRSGFLPVPLAALLPLGRRRAP